MLARNTRGRKTGDTRMNFTRNYDLVIWDWNGTLLDDTELCYSIANEMRLERGMSLMQGIEEYRTYFTFPVVDYYRRMGYTFETEPFENISRQFVAMYAERFPDCALQQCAKEALAAVLESRARQVLLSATGQEKLDEQVLHFGLNDYFERVIGGNNNLANGKADYARAFLRESGVHPARTLFVGDTDHDFEIASSIGCGCALITNGHQTREHLALLGATLVDSLCDIPALL
ncbi:MAG: phosphoglycolate phosphatase [Clostridiales bacterium]|nr:phosphoglycolate phosphatase [Clostridiales bacterium]